MKQNKYRVVDLFSGAGGMSLGFESAGFENVFSVDIEPSFCDTYKRNFPSHRLVNVDIQALADNEILQLSDGKGVDVVIGGPPCQGFSMAGNIGRKFIDDPRNMLFKQFARVVSVLRPRFFVMENVARLFTHNSGRTRKEIVELFESCGYVVKCEVLNTVDYDVPQQRRRSIFIGSRVCNAILFPAKSKSAQKTVSDAIGHFPKLESGCASYDYPNHIAMRHTQQMLEKMSYVVDGGGRDSMPESIRPKSGDVRKYIRYCSKKPSVCITGDMRKVFHYSQNRALTVRELAAIQTFPDDFVFKGNSISQQQQVGNSVPPKFAEHIGLTIKKMLDNDK